MTDVNLHITLLDMFTAGSETTSNVLTWGLLYLTAHQEVQETLYKEIIKIVGAERSPQLSDRQK